MIRLVGLWKRGLCYIHDSNLARVLREERLKFPEKDRTETVENKRARLLYQSRKRGTLENDILLPSFSAVFLPSFSESQLSEYDSLLRENEWDIYAWATGNKPVPDDLQSNSVLALLRKHVNRQQALRRPNLDD